MPVEVSPRVCSLLLVVLCNVCHTHTQVHSEAELKRILPIAKKHGVPVTFRAAGTSLSGQALTDSVLLKLSHTGKNFRNYTIHVRGCAGHRPGSSSSNSGAEEQLQQQRSWI